MIMSFASSSIFTAFLPEPLAKIAKKSETPKDSQFFCGNGWEIAIELFADLRFFRTFVVYI